MINPDPFSREDLLGLSDIILSYESEDPIVYKELEPIRKKIHLHLQYLDHH